MSPRVEVVNVQDCDIVGREFDLPPLYYVHFRINTFGKGYIPSFPLAIGLILPLIFFYKDDFGIKSITKVDMPLNKETKAIIAHGRL